MTYSRDDFRVMAREWYARRVLPPIIAHIRERVAHLLGYPVTELSTDLSHPRELDALGQLFGREIVDEARDKMA